MPVFKAPTLLNTRAVYFKKIGVRNQVIYCVFMAFVIMVLGSLPFLTTTVGINGSGVVQSQIAKIDLVIPANGRLIYLNLSDNQQVVKNEILIIVDGSLNKKEYSLLQKRVSQVVDQLADVRFFANALESNSPIAVTELKTVVYRANFQLYAEQVERAKNTELQMERSYIRYQRLYLKGIVSQAEFEQHELNFKQAKSDQETLCKTYKSKLELEAHNYHNELIDLQKQQLQLKERQKLDTLKAAIAGSAQNLAGVQLGAYVYGNQKIGEINPDGWLVATCFLKSADIALVKIGQNVSIRIDAFNYHHWGFISGKVIDIMNDAVAQEQGLYFKVKCKIDRNYLQLKNGYKGYIKKGMTLKAHFIIAKRTLYQILFDSVGDWI